jgi:hypothetical protein
VKAPHDWQAASMFTIAKRGNVKVAVAAALAAGIEDDGLDLCLGDVAAAAAKRAGRARRRALCVWACHALFFAGVPDGDRRGGGKGEDYVRGASLWALASRLSLADRGGECSMRVRSAAVLVSAVAALWPGKGTDSVEFRRFAVMHSALAGGCFFLEATGAEPFLTLGAAVGIGSAFAARPSESPHVMRATAAAVLVAEAAVFNAAAARDGVSPADGTVLAPLFLLVSWDGILFATKLLHTYCNVVLRCSSTHPICPLLRRHNCCFALRGSRTPQGG